MLASTFVLIPLRTKTERLAKRSFWSELERESALENVANVRLRVWKLLRD